MAITVLLVRVLNPEGASNSNTMRLATAYYDEKVRDHWTRTDSPSLHVKSSPASFAWARVLLPCRKDSLLAQETDSATTKFEGAMVNALIVVAAVTGMTFILFLLYKYRVCRLLCIPATGQVHLNLVC